MNFTPKVKSKFLVDWAPPFPIIGVEWAPPSPITGVEWAPQYKIGGHSSPNGIEIAPLGLKNKHVDITRGGMGRKLLDQPKVKHNRLLEIF